MIETTRYSKIVKSYLQESSDFQDALKITKKLVPEGKIWLIGGQVFRPILKELYNIEYNSSSDFDFIIEQLPLIRKKDIPKGFTLGKTGLGAPSLTKDDLQIDLIPLTDATRLSQQDLQLIPSEKRIWKYFQRVPLNIQAIVYDISNDSVIGQEAIEGIQNKVIKPMDLEECLSFCKRRGISLRKFFDTKIEGEIFRREYPDFHTESKVKTTEYYNENIEEYSSRKDFDNFVLKYFPDEVSYFLEELSGRDIIDIGAGTGRDSKYFISQGYIPFAIDISQGMVDYMKDRNIKAEQMDIENCYIKEDSFDGAYAFCSLLHIPKKRMFNAIARISEILRENGKMFICMIEGKGENEYRDRYFALYSEEELRVELEPYFKIEREKKVQVGSQTYIVLICSKNKQEYAR